MTNTNANALISVRNLEKHFGELKVLRGVSQDIQQGEKLVVIGVAVALVAVLASAALQFAVLIHFRKNAEKYSAMESC